MRKSLVKYLACPKCKTKLKLEAKERQAGEIKTGVLKCSDCRKQYLITNFIPRFVRNDKEVENFSFEWQIHQTTQLDSFNRNKLSRREFIEKTGFEKKDLKGKLVLDAGCGMGRYMEVAKDFGAEVIGVDLSFAVDNARENLENCNKCHFIQADIFNLPFKDNTFDIAFSIGVLHHTPNTKKAFMNLPILLKKGGKLAIWVYGKNQYRPYTYFGDFWRQFTHKIPKRLLYGLSHLSVPLYWTYRIPVLGRLINILFPYATHSDWRWRVLDTFDWYSPKYQWKHFYPEIAEWYEEADLEVVKILEHEASLLGIKK